MHRQTRPRRISTGLFSESSLARGPPYYIGSGARFKSSTMAWHRKLNEPPFSSSENNTRTGFLTSWHTVPTLRVLQKESKGAELSCHRSFDCIWSGEIGHRVSTSPRLTMRFFAHSSYVILIAIRHTLLEEGPIFTSFTRHRRSGGASEPELFESQL